MSWSSNVVDWWKYIGRRVLVVSRLDVLLKMTTYPIEVTVMAVSPSGKYVKLKFDRGCKWVSADEYVVVEVLD